MTKVQRQIESAATIQAQAPSVVKVERGSLSQKDRKQSWENSGRKCGRYLDTTPGDTLASCLGVVRLKIRSRTVTSVSPESFSVGMRYDKEHCMGVG